MRDQESFGKQASIAAEMQAIVKCASAPVKPGESIKTQMVRSWNALGRPAFWRVRAAWWGDAGAWVGSAVEEFRARSAALNERNRRKEDARAHAITAETALAHARLRRLRAALTHADEEFYREAISAIDWAISSNSPGNPSSK